MSNSMMAGDFAAVAVALYVGHHVGDYWVQTDEQAKHKGDAGKAGRLACLAHVATYLLTQNLLFVVMGAVFDWQGRYLLTIWPALLVSGVTHYMADRREHGLMFKLARLIPGKANFLKLGKPRHGNILVHLDHNPTMKRVPLDNPTLGTGAWALDQSWHILWGVFVPTLLVVAL